MSGHELFRELPAPRRRPDAMRALIPPLLLGCTSLACGLAGVGVALHGVAWPPALLYGGFGAVAGLVCTLLHWAHHRLPVHEVVPAEAGGEAPAAVLARTLLARIAEAQARTPPARASAPAPAAGAPAVTAAAAPTASAASAPDAAATLALAGDAHSPGA